MNNNLVATSPPVSLPATIDHPGDASMADFEIRPKTVSLSGNQTQAFEAFSDGKPVHGLRWSILPSQGSGTIEPDTGIYSAPRFVLVDRKAYIRATRPGEQPAIPARAAAPPAAAAPQPGPQEPQGLASPAAVPPATGMTVTAASVSGPKKGASADSSVTKDAGLALHPQNAEVQSGCRQGGANRCRVGLIASPTGAAAKPGQP